MKALFLDNDGVICLDNNWGGRFKKWNIWKKLHPETISYNDTDVFHRFDDFDKKAVKVLNEILIETGAEIIVSSDWKKQATLEELGDYYEAQGIIKRPFALTRTFIGCDKPEGFEWLKGLKYEQERSLEIKQFVTDNPEITHWVAVDDLDMAWAGTWGLVNFVHTPKMSEGIKQCNKKEKIIKFLT